MAAAAAWAGVGARVLELAPDCVAAAPAWDVSAAAYDAKDPAAFRPFANFALSEPADAHALGPLASRPLELGRSPGGTGPGPGPGRWGWSRAVPLGGADCSSKARGLALPRIAGRGRAPAPHASRSVSGSGAGAAGGLPCAADPATHAAILFRFLQARCGPLPLPLSSRATSGCWLTWWVGAWRSSLSSLFRSSDPPTRPTLDDPSVISNYSAPGHPSRFEVCAVGLSTHVVASTLTSRYTSSPTSPTSPTPPTFLTAPPPCPPGGRARVQAAVAAGDGIDCLPACCSFMHSVICLVNYVCSYVLV
jgi:hypothetical protein